MWELLGRLVSPRRLQRCYRFFFMWLLTVHGIAGAQAIFQCLQGLPEGGLRRIILTASGGAFRDWPVEKLKEVTAADAVKHPNWRSAPTTCPAAAAATRSDRHAPTELKCMAWKCFTHLQQLVDAISCPSSVSTVIMGGHHGC